MRIGLRDSRYKFPKETRKFGGKVFQYHSVGTKAECQKDAKRYQALGYQTRVVKSGRQHIFYTRK